MKKKFLMAFPVILSTVFCGVNFTACGQTDDDATNTVPTETTTSDTKTPKSDDSTPKTDETDTPTESEDKLALIKANFNSLVSEMETTGKYTYAKRDENGRMTYLVYVDGTTNVVFAN